MQKLLEKHAVPLGPFSLRKRDTLLLDVWRVLARLARDRRIHGRAVKPVGIDRLVARDVFGFVQLVDLSAEAVHRLDLLCRDEVHRL